MQQTRSNRAWAAFIFAILVLQVTTAAAITYEQNPQPASRSNDNEITGFPSGWSEDFRLSYASDYSKISDIAVDSNNVYIVWSDKRSGSYEVYFKKSEDSGRTWSEDMKISEYTPSPFCKPKIAVNGSQLHVVWEGLDLTREVHYRNSTDGGFTWNQEVRLTEDDGIQSGLPVICVWGDNVHIMWTEKKTDSDGDIYYRNSTDGGTIWNPEQRLTNSPDAETGVDIAVYASKIHITWARWVPNEMFYMNSSDGGITWSPEQQMSSIDGIDTLPYSIAVWQNNVHIAYRDAIEGSIEVYYLNSIDGGASWNPSKRISDLPASSINPHICADDEKIFITWQDQRDNNPYPGAWEIYYAVSYNNGTDWSANIRLTNSTVGSSGGPLIGAYDDVVHVLWSDNRSSDVINETELFYKRYPNFPADTMPPIINHTLATNIHYSQPINITAEISDNVALLGIWLNYTDVNGTNHNVSMNGWDRKMVMVSGLGPTLYAQNGNYSYEIPAQGWPGLLNYFLWVNDTEGNVIQTSNYQVNVYDNTLPEIYHSPTAPINVNTLINVTATITDDITVDSVYLNYTGVDGTNNNVSMNRWGSNWSYEIPGQNNTGVVEYFIWTNDTSGNVNQTGNYTVQIIDITAPEIVHTPKSPAYVFDAINITAGVTDNVAVDAVFLNYTDVHGDNQNITMNKWNGNWSFDIPGQTNTGTVEYFIWANDTSGNANMTDIFQIQIYDVTAPVITHAPPLTAPLDTPINIVANVTDDVGVSNVTLYYGNVSDTSYRAVDMVLDSGNWTATIPAQGKTGTVHYYIWANDTSGNNATSPTMGAHIVQITGPPGISIAEPGGGERWTGGSNHQIQFTASDTEDEPGDLTVFLNYTFGAGGGFIAQVTGASSPYNWLLPKINATDVKIIATVIDSDGNKAFAESPMFTIDSSMLEIISTSPGNNSTGISLSQPIIIQFSEPMNISSVVVNQTNGTNPGGWQWFWNPEEDTITGIHNAWPRGETVEITVHAGYKDASEPGNANNTAYVFTFITEINPSPEIIHANVTGPIELGDFIMISATITDDGTVMNAVLWWRDVDGVWHENYMQKTGNDWSYFLPGQMAEGLVRYQINATDNLGQKNSTIIYEFDIEDTVAPYIAHTPVESAVINEPINITCLVADLGGVGAVYLHYRNESEANYTQVIMSPGYWYELAARSEPGTIEHYIRAVDAYGNEASTGIYSLAIIDPAIPDTTPPEIWFTGPTGSNIPVSTSISIVFSEAMDRAAVEGAITLSPAITGTSYTWLNDQTLVLSFDALRYNTTYTVTIGTGAADMARNNLASAYSWQFTTVGEMEIVEPPTPNDWGWIGLIIFLVVIIALLLLYLFNKEKKEPDNNEEEPMTKERGPPDA